MNDQRDEDMDRFMSEVWKSRQMLGAPYENAPNIYVFPYAQILKLAHVPEKIMHHAKSGTDGALLVIKTPAGRLYYVPADEWSKQSAQQPQQPPVPQMQANTIRTR